MINWVNGNQGLAERDNADPNRAWAFYITPAGLVAFKWYSTGLAASSITVTSTTNPGFVSGKTYWLRATLTVNNGAAGNDVRFYFSNNQPTEPTAWTQIGATVTTAGVTAMVAVTAGINMGGNASGNMTGRIFRFILRNSIGGTVVADANYSIQKPGIPGFTEDSATANTIGGYTGAATVQIQGHRINLLSDGVYRAWVEGMKYARFICSQYNSGTITVNTAETRHA